MADSFKPEGPVVYVRARVVYTDGKSVCVRVYDPIRQSWSNMIHTSKAQVKNTFAVMGG